MIIAKKRNQILALYQRAALLHFRILYGTASAAHKRWLFDRWDATMIEISELAPQEMRQ